jgi:Zn-dependent peptidase ImmA (M78 family)
MSAEVNVNSNMLQWAITRAGLELHDLTKAFPKITEWLQASKKPTLKQLENFSNKVHIPFGYLLLAEPPQESIPFPFFRTNTTTDKPFNIHVYDTILLVQQRQEWLKEYLEDLEFDPLPFVGQFSAENHVDEIVANIRQTLNLSPDWANRFTKWEEALEHLTQQIEEAGIIIFFNGVVENNTSRPIPVDECRGFVMVDDVAPIMFINNADAKAAQMFTLVHELAHIWIGQSAGFDIQQMLPANDPIEILCDHVAAEFLVPKTLFLEKWSSSSDIRRLSRFFKVSPIVIGRRALDLGCISRLPFLSFTMNTSAILKVKKRIKGQVVISMPLPEND